jgi:hypothetical protein
MEDDLNFSGNARQPQFFRKWKTTSIFQEMQDDLNFSGNGRRPQFFRKWRMISISGHEKRTTIFRIWKRTLIIKEMEDNLKFSENSKQLKTTSIKYQLFLLANVESKFPIKNNLQLNESQPSLT